MPPEHMRSNMPDVRYTTVELHIGKNPDFMRRYGQDVKARGGYYRDAHGDVTTRIVFVPAQERDLIDAIAWDFGAMRGTPLIARDIGGATPAVGFWFNLEASCTWKEGMNATPSELLERRFLNAAAAIDWDGYHAVKAEDGSTAARLQTERETVALKDDLLREAVEILDGKTNTEELRRIAAAIVERMGRPSSSECAIQDGATTHYRAF